MERDIDAGHQLESLGTAGAFGDRRLQCVESGLIADHHVLRAAQVQVHDLGVLVRAFEAAFDPVREVCVVDLEQLGPDRGHGVRAASLRIAGHQLLHDAAAVEHGLQDGAQRQYPGRRERVVLTHRVACDDRIIHAGTDLGEFGQLCTGHGGHRDLGELGEVQHPVGMGVDGAVGPNRQRIVADHGEDGEAEILAGVLVGGVPDLAGGLAARALGQAHTLALNALAGEDVGGDGREGHGGGGHHQVLAHAGADLEQLAAAVDTHALDGELHLVAGEHHAQETGGPAAKFTVHHIAVGGGRDLLRGGREPHAVHDRAGQACERRGDLAGVNRVVIAGDCGEAAHVLRGLHGDLPDPLARRLGGGLTAGTAGGLRVGQLRLAGAATDREPLGHGDRGIGAGCAHIDADGDHGADVGGGHVFERGGGAVRARRGVGGQLDGVIEVNQVQHALDDGASLCGLRGADHGERRRPAQADEGVRHGQLLVSVEGGQPHGETVRGDGRVIGGVLRAEVEIDGGSAVVDCRQIAGGGQCDEPLTWPRWPRRAR
ncbi:hypothetical protein TPAU25S_00038 [Tsukamurella paurometabola]